MQADAIHEARRRQDHSQELAKKGWYHSFELPDGTTIDGLISVPRLRDRFARFGLPEQLHGKRVLDIGAWDGWFTFEAERRGAVLTSIDCVEAPHFVDLRQKLQSKTDYRILEIYELPEAGLGQFDIVFLLGVLYHLRHPLLGLEIVCGLTTDTAIIESFVTDGETWQEHAAEIPTMEFYEGYELANQFDNWSGPSVSCLMAMCRAAGFARVELLHTEPYNAIVACHRKWEPQPAETAAAPPDLRFAVNHVTQGINFSSRKELYISCWYRSNRGSIAKEDLRLEVGQFGVAAYYTARREDGWWVANFPLPRGLSPGWHAVRLRFADSGFGEPVRIAVDMPAIAGRIVCDGVRDPTNWNDSILTVTDRGYLTCWVAGLPENADCDNVRLFLGGRRLEITWFGAQDAEGRRQINALVPGSMAKGEQALRIECGGTTSAPWGVRIV